MLLEKSISMWSMENTVRWACCGSHQVQNFSVSQCWIQPQYPILQLLIVSCGAVLQHITQLTAILACWFTVHKSIHVLHPFTLSRVSEDHTRIKWAIGGLVLSQINTLLKFSCFTLFRVKMYQNSFELCLQRHIFPSLAFTVAISDYCTVALLTMTAGDCKLSCHNCKLNWLWWLLFISAFHVFENIKYNIVHINVFFFNIHNVVKIVQYRKEINKSWGSFDLSLKTSFGNHWSMF